MSDTMQYPNSNMSPGAARPQPQQQYSREDQGPVTGVDRNDLAYPSLSSQGLVEIELPLPSSSNSLCKVEKVLVRNLPRHIAEQVERGFRDGTAHGTLAWYVTHCKAAKLFDAGVLGHMEKLVNAFATSRKPERHFNDNVQPYLLSLVPQKRG